MLIKTIDNVSKTAASISRYLFIILIAAMLYEVVARYVFNSSTIWAFDISYMSAGAAFMLGMGWTLQVDGHVKIDIIMRLFPDSFQKNILGTFYLFVLFPLFSVISWHGWVKTLNAFNTGEVETVSTWAPVMWPFYLALAVGLTTLSLQLFAEGVRKLGLKTERAD